MHLIHQATFVFLFVYSSSASPIAHFFPKIRERVSGTELPHAEASLLVARNLQATTTDDGEDHLKVVPLIPSTIYPSGTTGSSKVVYNPYPATSSSGAERQSSSSVDPVPVTLTTAGPASADSSATPEPATSTSSRLTAGTIRPLSDAPSSTSRTSPSLPAATTADSPETKASSMQKTLSSTSTSRAVGSIVKITHSTAESHAPSSGSSAFGLVIVIVSPDASTTETLSSLLSTSSSHSPVTGKTSSTSKGSLNPSETTPMPVTSSTPTPTPTSTQPSASASSND